MIVTATQVFCLVDRETPARVVEGRNPRIPYQAPRLLAEFTSRQLDVLSEKVSKATEATTHEVNSAVLPVPSVAAGVLDNATVRAKVPHDAPYLWLDVVVLVKSLKALVDTGAAVNILDRSVVAHVPHLIQFALARWLLAFNASEVQPIRYVLLDLSVLRRL